MLRRQFHELTRHACEPPQLPVDSSDQRARVITSCNPITRGRVGDVEPKSPIVWAAPWLRRDREAPPLAVDDVNCFGVIYALEQNHPAADHGERPGFGERIPSWLHRQRGNR